jgi:hypothetical protein
VIGNFIRKEKLQLSESIDLLTLFFFAFIFYFRKIKELQANAARSIITKTNNDVSLLFHQYFQIDGNDILKINSLR